MSTIYTDTTEYPTVPSAQHTPKWVTVGSTHLVTVSIGLLLAGIPVAVIYALVSAQTVAPGWARTMLATAAAILLLLSGAAGIGAHTTRQSALLAWQLHLEGMRGAMQAEQTHVGIVRQLRRDAQEVGRACAAGAAELRQLPEDLRIAVGRQGKAHLAVAQEIRQSLVAEVAAVKSQVERLGQSALQDHGGGDEYLAGYADGLAGRVLDQPHVRGINGRQGGQ